MGKRAEIPIQSFPASLPGIESGKSLYLCVYDAVRECLLSEAWQAGTLLPSEGELASYWGISKGTVREALYHLFEDGAICKAQGRRASVSHFQQEGNYLYQMLSSPVRSFCTEPVSPSLFSYSCVTASRWMASLLELNEGMPLVKGVLDYSHEGEFRARVVFYSSFVFLEREKVRLDDEARLVDFIENTVYRIADTSRSSISVVDEVEDSEISAMPLPLLFMEDHLYEGDRCFIDLRYYLHKDWFRIQTLRRKV